MRVVTSAQMRQIEDNSLRHSLSAHRLMENAGSAAASFVRRAFKIADRNCIIFCSKGNNGGDGLVVARKLTESDVNVVVTLLDGKPDSDEAMDMYRQLEAMGVPLMDFAETADKLRSWLSQADLVIDAICGTGFKGELRENHRRACELINSCAAAVVALDIPTGLECDSGRVARGAVRADFTLVFDCLKPAHVLNASKEHCGTIEVLDIGIPEEAHRGIRYETYGPELSREVEEVTRVRAPVSADAGARPVTAEQRAPLAVEPDTPAAPASEAAQAAEKNFETAMAVELEKPASVAVAVPAKAPPAQLPVVKPAAVERMTLTRAFELLPVRATASHKGDHGKLVNVAGSAQYRGAAILSTLAALRCGTGLVTLCATEPVCAAAVLRTPEACFVPMAHNDIGTIDGTLPLTSLTEVLERATAVVFGCGLGNNLHTSRLLEHVLKNAACPLVLDADGINALAGNIHVLKEAKGPVVLTPHPGEMARLLGVSPEQVQADRGSAALGFAAKHNVTVVLKGHGSVIASPDGGMFLNETGNPGLAKGGSGDVLAGIIGAFLAQGLEPKFAAAVGVFLHGTAADRTAKRVSMTAMLPGEILDDLARLFVERGR